MEHSGEALGQTRRLPVSCSSQVVAAQGRAASAAARRKPAWGVREQGAFRVGGWEARRGAVGGVVWGGEEKGLMRQLSSGW